MVPVEGVWVVEQRIDPDYYSVVIYTDGNRKVYPHLRWLDPAKAQQFADRLNRK